MTPDGLCHGARELGNDGESAAALYLESRGFRIAARNLRIGRTEVDLVARKRGTLVFCEVKTRRSARLGLPELAVNARKQQRLLRAAAAYLARHPPAGEVRFDVISVVEDDRGHLRVRHIEGAFRPW
ncbi:MAG: YraN family protein [Gemmatimonadetes bacterium]|nr:YraN family protein [Gemmatimonadota bacterium]